MTVGTLEQMYEFALSGVALPTVTHHSPALELTVEVQHTDKPRLSVRIENAALQGAQATADRFATEFYQRMALTFSTDLANLTPPNAIRTVFTPNGSTAPTVNTARIYADPIVAPRAPTPLAPKAIMGLLAECDTRVNTPPVPTSAQLYSAIDMFTVGLAAPNSVVRFLVFYSALSLGALFKSHSGKQPNVDALIRTVKPGIQVSQSPKGMQETLYTKLRNDLIHAEERGCDPAAAIRAIEGQVQAFQADAAGVLRSL